MRTSEIESCESERLSPKQIWGKRRWILNSFPLLLHDMFGHHFNLLVFYIFLVRRVFFQTLSWSCRDLCCVCTTVGFVGRCFFATCIVTFRRCVSCHFILWDFIFSFFKLYEFFAQVFEFCCRGCFAFRGHLFRRVNPGWPGKVRLNSGRSELSVNKVSAVRLR